MTQATNIADASWTKAVMSVTHVLTCALDGNTGRDGTQGTGIAATSLGAYSNPGSQVGTQNKDLGAVWQTDLTRV